MRTVDGISEGAVERVVTPGESKTTVGVRGVGWMLMGSGGVATVGLGLSALLARILPPEDFGLVVLLLSTVAVLQLFSEFGLSVAVIQMKHLDPVTRDNALYLSLVAALLVGITITIARVPLAEALGRTEIGPLVPWIGGLLVLRSLYSVYRSLLLRDLRYRTVAGLEFIGHVIYASTAVALAGVGLGPASIVLGQSAASAFLLTATARTARVFPRSHLSLASWPRIAGIGFWVAFNRVLNQAAAHVDKLIIASIVSPAALGAYYIAQQLANALPNLVAGSVSQVALPLYSRIQDDTITLERQYWKSMRLVMISVFPIIVLVASHADALVALVFGEQWLFAAGLVRIICLFALIGAMGGGVFSAVLYARGKTVTVFVTSAFRAIALPLCVIVGGAYGVEGVAWGLVFYGLLGRLFNQVVMSRSMGFEFAKFFIEIWRPTMIAATMYGTGSLATALEITRPIAIIAQLASYAVLAWLVLPNDARFLWEQLAKHALQVARLGINPRRDAT